MEFGHKTLMSNWQNQQMLTIPTGDELPNGKRKWHHVNKRHYKRILCYMRNINRENDKI